MAHAPLVQERCQGHAVREVAEHRETLRRDDGGLRQKCRALDKHVGRVEVAEWIFREKRELPEGTLEVPMNQPLARLAFYLIEPRSDDGLVTWNFMDDQLAGDPKVYSILRSRK